MKMANSGGLLVVTLAKDFACCRINEMGLSARQTGDGLIGVVRHFVGGKALYGLAGARTAKEKRRHSTPDLSGRLWKPRYEARRSPNLQVATVYKLRCFMDRLLIIDAFHDFWFARKAPIGPDGENAIF